MVPMLLYKEKFEPIQAMRRSLIIILYHSDNDVSSTYYY